MCETMDEFEICAKIDPKLRKIIKYFHVIDDQKGNNVLFVTIDDKVFAFGANYSGVCGLGHELPVKEPELVRELCDKSVQEFHNGFGHVVALTATNQVYVWGLNESAQLATGGRNPFKLFRPRALDMHTTVGDDPIVQIGCGSTHTLLLTANGRVYVWGCNRFGQCGCGEDESEKFVTKVTELEALNNIRFIHCSSDQSFAVTNEGLVYSWGLNKSHKLGLAFGENKCVFTPTIIDSLSDVKSICCATNNTYFLQDNNKILVCGLINEDVVREHHEIPRIMDYQDNNDTLIALKSLTSNVNVHKELAIAIGENSLWSLERDRMTRIDYSLAPSSFKYFAIVLGLTYKTMATYADEDDESLRSAKSLTNGYTQSISDNEQTQLVDDFPICEHLGAYQYQLKLLKIFDDANGFNMLFVNNNDEVYGFGSNQYGVCGLGDNLVISEPKNIPQLSAIGITQFHNGLTFALCLTYANQVFIWGTNIAGEFGKEIPENQVTKPKCVLHFEDQAIEKISCGYSHALLLTSAGRVFGWGANYAGQLGCGQQHGDSVAEFKEICLLENIQHIHCTGQLSFTVTKKGQVYSWGKNHLFLSGHELPKDHLIWEPMQIPDLKNVISICCSLNNTYFLTKKSLLYDDEGQLVFNMEYFNFERAKKKESHMDYQYDLHFCGIYHDSSTFIDRTRYVQQSPLLLTADVPMDSLHSLMSYSKHFEIGCAVDDNHILYFDNMSANPTNYKNLYEFYANECQLTYKTVDFEIQKGLNEQFQETFVLDHYLENKYTYKRKIEEGQFGCVYEVRKINKKSALKIFRSEKIVSNNLQVEYIIGEIKHLANIKGDRIVDYSNSWIDDNNNLYIEMMLCSDSLKNILEVKPEFFGRTADELLNVTEYCLTTQIFVEILEAVRHLHSMDPPLLHRDLKPGNILFDDRGRALAFFKLCDFGLAMYHDLNKQDRVGTKSYMAPESWYKGQYTIKSDVYSLGVVAQRLFQVNLIAGHDDSNKYDHLELVKDQFKALYDILVRMDSESPDDRPSCDDILERKCDLSIAFSEEYMIEADFDKIKREASDSLMLYLKWLCFPQQVQQDLIYQNLLQITHDTFNFNVDKLANTGDDEDLLDQNYVTLNDETKENEHAESIDENTMPQNYHQETSISDELTAIIDQELKKCFENTQVKDKHYEIVREIGAGTYGIVYEVDIENKRFALKKFLAKKIEQANLDTKHIIREVIILQKLNNDRIIQYFDKWIDSKNNLYIQMEYCSDDLQNILEAKALFFGRNIISTLDSVEYYITSLLFLEILEAVQYLHSHKPPVLHRDLKPANILFDKNGIKSGIFIKVCDFGLAKFVDQDKSNTRILGTPGYTAPEVQRTNNYDTKSDVYSVGKIGEKLFDMDLDKNDTFQSEIEEFNTLMEILKQMVTTDPKTRPDCSFVFELSVVWIISKKTIKNLNNFDEQMARIDSNRSSSLNTYISHHFMSKRV